MITNITFTKIHKIIKKKVKKVKLHALQIYFNIVPERKTKPKKRNTLLTFIQQDF